MLILEAEQVKYCNVVRKIAEREEIIPGISYQGNLFVKAKSFDKDQLEIAIKQCRELFLDAQTPILALIIKDKTGFSIWSQDNEIKLADSGSAKNDAKFIDLNELVAQMRGEKGVEIKARPHKLRLYSRCFVGSEAVDWLTNHLKISRSEAVELGQRLIEAQFIHHVLDEHPFRDDNLLYRFYEDEGKSIWTDKVL